MRSLHWGSAKSGSWDVASNWSPADVPRSPDQVTIDAVAAASTTYTVTIPESVWVAALTINSANADVLAERFLTAGSTVLEAGTLEIAASAPGSVTGLRGGVALMGGTLLIDPGSSFAGTLTQTGGALDLKDSTLSGTVNALGGTVSINGTTFFNSVTWHGALDQTGTGELVLANSATFTGANSTGAGQATLYSITLSKVSSLDNATISLTSNFDNLQIKNTPALTFGSNLVLQNASIIIFSDTVLTNDGTLAGSANFGDGVIAEPDNAAAGATFINNGLIAGDFTDGVGSLTNNGVMDCNFFSFGGALTNTGTILVDTRFGAGYGGFTNDGTVTVGAGGRLDLGSVGASDINAGIITVDGGGTMVLLGTLINDGAIAIRGGTFGPVTDTDNSIAGTGLIALEAAAGTPHEAVTVDLNGAMGSGQTLAFLSGHDLLTFGSIADALGFAGTITGLDTSGPFDPSFQFDGATIHSAGITGSAFDIVFSTGDTATLATGTALAGTLSFSESHGNAILHYTPPA